MELEQVSRLAKELNDNISKVIVGKKEEINLVLTALLAEGHVLMEDMPGTGKTSLAKALAASIDGDFKRIQFTPDLLPQDITGLNIYSRAKEQFELMKGPVFTNILLADEINRATPRTQSGLLECMEEKQVTIDGQTLELEQPFFIIATQNPIETAGTYPLPEAQLDRFAMQIAMGYPRLEEELVIMDRFIAEDPLAELKPVCSKEDIGQMQQAVKQVYVHPDVRKYIAELAQMTRNHKSIVLGINSRAVLCLLRCSQAYAAMDGRNYVTPNDVKQLAVPVFAHRILTYTSRHRSANIQLLQEILEQVAVPTEDWSRWHS